MKETVFFIDRCLGNKVVAQALRKTGVKVEVHDDHFAKDALDCDWLPIVGEKNWIVLTQDNKIAYRNLECLAVIEYSLRLFVLASKNLNGRQKGKAFSDACPKMIKFTEGNSAPFIAKVYAKGIVKEWKNNRDLLKYQKRIIGNIQER